MNGTIVVKVTDKLGNQYSAIEIGPDKIALYDHDGGAEMAILSQWRHAAAALELLQA